jgi:hypothetical protein
MKGQTKELIELLILAIGLVIALMISNFFLVSLKSTISESFVDVFNYERIGNVVNAFYLSKVSGTGRTLSQLLGDRIATEANPVIYGDYFGNIDVDNQTIQFFDSYFGKQHWQLKTKLPSGKEFILGYEILINIRRVQTFEILIPIPSLENKIWKVDLSVW